MGLLRGGKTRNAARDALIRLGIEDAVVEASTGQPGAGAWPENGIVLTKNGLILIQPPWSGSEGFRIVEWADVTQVSGGNHNFVVHVRSGFDLFLYSSEWRYLTKVATDLHAQSARRPGALVEAVARWLPRDPQRNGKHGSAAILPDLGLVVDTMEDTRGLAGKVVPLARIAHFSTTPTDAQDRATRAGEGPIEGYLLKEATVDPGRIYLTMNSENYGADLLLTVEDSSGWQRHLIGLGVASR